MGKFRALETDLERMKEKIEMENEAKAEIQKAMSKALAEAQIWKSKYTTEACARIEDLENAKAKLLVCCFLLPSWCRPKLLFDYFSGQDW